MTQWIGLSDAAKKLVTGEQILLYTEHTTRVYPDGHAEAGLPVPIHGSTVKREPSGEIVEDVFGGSDIPLEKYTLPDGRVLFERVQADPWSSGPVIFTALQTADGQWVKESLWTDEQIEAQV